MRDSIWNTIKHSIGILFLILLLSICVKFTLDIFVYSYSSNKLDSDTISSKSGEEIICNTKLNTIEYIIRSLQYTRV